MVGFWEGSEVQCHFRVVLCEVLRAGGADVYFYEL